MPLRVLVHTLVGTALVAGGAAALNQVWERDTDRLMRRTAARPLPGGRLGVAEGTWFGVAAVGRSASLQLAFGGQRHGRVRSPPSTLVSYVLVYTPLKTRTSLATLVGAIPGALPPVIGWAAATGTISLPALVLFGIVFFWQMPHFLAIAWMYRDDYARAGIPLLPVLEPDGRRTGQQALLYAAALWPVSLLPVVVGLAGPPTPPSPRCSGSLFIGLSVRFAQDRSQAQRAAAVSVLDHVPDAAAGRAGRRPRLDLGGDDDLRSPGAQRHAERDLGLCPHHRLRADPRAAIG